MLMCHMWRMRNKYQLEESIVPTMEIVMASTLKNHTFSFSTLDDFLVPLNPIAIQTLKKPNCPNVEDDKKTKDGLCPSGVKYKACIQGTHMFLNVAQRHLSRRIWLAREWVSTIKAHHKLELFDLDFLWWNRRFIFVENQRVLSFKMFNCGNGRTSPSQSTIEQKRELFSCSNASFDDQACDWKLEVPHTKVMTSHWHLDESR